MDTFHRLRFVEDALTAVRCGERLLRRFLQTYIMDQNQLASLFTEKDDLRTLGHLNSIYVEAAKHGLPEARALATGLTAYYLREGRHHRLPLGELQSGLSYRSNTELWRAIVRLGIDESFVSQHLDDPEGVRGEMAHFTVFFAGDLRRAGRLDEAERLLQPVQEVYSGDPKWRGKLAMVEYELGYINFLQADVDLCLSYFQQSWKSANQHGDEVGAWIAKCLEYRARWLFGRATRENVLLLFETAKLQFRRLTSIPGRGLVAQRWVWGVTLHQIEVAYSLRNFKLARGYWEEVLAVPEEELPNVPEFLTPYRAMVVTLDGDGKEAARLMRRVIDVKASSGADWYKSEAGAMDQYLLGYAHLRAAQPEEARASWLEGEKFQHSMGNQVWRSLCEAELEVLAMGVGRVAGGGRQKKRGSF